MRTLLISYDLVNKSIFDYSKLISYIKSYNAWAKPLESVWFVRTEKNVADVRSELRLHISANDKLLVLDITGVNWATFNIAQGVSDWMKTNI